MKKRLIGLILILLLALQLFPVTAISSDPINSFSLTNYKEENISFSLGKNRLTVTNLPDNTAFSSVWINIVNKSGLVQIKQTLNRDKNGSVSMSLSRLNDGYYYIELYFYLGNSQYNSYIFGNELGFNWSNNTGSFVLSPAYEHNKKVFENGRSDEKALTYYLQQTSSIQSTNADIVKKAEEITKGITDNYQKAYAIHKWVCINIWYIWDATENEKKMNGNAVSALATRRAICTGYSTLMAALLRAVGIPAKTVSGHGRNTAKTGEWTKSQLSGQETTHYWNEAYIDGRWIIIDATWDSGNDYLGGKKIASDGLYFNRYFDPTLEAFSMDHYINDYEESSIAPTDSSLK
jgi:hypothetical protein